MSILTKIEIKGLWGTTDIEWDLKPDVNILGGHNGSGKSTILKIIATFVHSFQKREVSKLFPLFDELILIIENETFSVKIFKKQNLDDLKQKLELFNYSNVKETIQFIQQQKILSDDTISLLAIESKVDEHGNRTTLLKQNIDDLFHSYYISSVEYNFIDRFSVEFHELDFERNTILDYEMVLLFNLYINYRLNLSKKIQQLFDSNSIEDIRSKQKQIYQYKKRFEELINQLFSETGKILIYEEETNQILFQKGEQKLTPYQLSSGEKQLLIILLSALIQDNKPTIMFLDEPEMGLHIDWQKKLIGYIRELNPNVQIITTTHSPGLILEKWIDTVVEISEISKIHE